MQEPSLAFIVQNTVLCVALVLVTGCTESTAPRVGSLDIDSTISARVEWLQSNVVRLSAVSPDSDDFSDLDPWRSNIGDTRVVVLGEASHGDGTTFLAKTRLIKFLHSEMDFDVLAFESGLYDMWKSWRFMCAGEDALTAIRRGVNSVWRESEQFQPLVDYTAEAKQTGHPLELAGFDPQFTGSASKQFLITDLESFLDGSGSRTPQDTAWTTFRGLLGRLVEGSWMARKPTDSEKALFDVMMARLQEEVDGLTEEGEVADAAFWLQVLRSMAAEAERVHRWVTGSPIWFNNARDEQMGRNLIWLAQEAYPDHKIIVWTATIHAVRNIEEINPLSLTTLYADVTTMGHAVWEALGSDVYVLAFVAHNGARAHWSQDPIPLTTPPEGSLEDLLHRTELAYAFLDLRTTSDGGEWLHERMVGRPIGHLDAFAVWPRHLDGLAFIDTMEASTEVTGYSNRVRPNRRMKLSKAAGAVDLWEQ